MLSSWSISRRIFVGFSVVITLILVLASISYVSTSRLGDSFGSFKKLAAGNVLVGNLVEDLFEARFAAVKYRSSASVTAAADVNASLDEITAEVANMRTVFADQPELLKIFEGTLADLERYRGGFARSIELGGQIAEALEVLDQSVDTSISSIDELLSAGFGAGDGNAIKTWTGIQRKMLRARNHLVEFLATGEEAELSLGLDLLNAAVATAQDAHASAFGAETTDAIGAIIEQLRSVLSAANELSALGIELDEVNTGVLDVVGPQLQGQYEKLQELSVARLDKNASEGADVISAITTTVLGVAVFTVVLSAILALVIGRSISGAVVGMTGAMEKLADGQLDTDLPDSKSQNELGRMAGALVVFRDNARSVARLNEERAEAERLAEQQRVAMMRDLSKAFGDVVSSASAGDFSARVSTDFDDPSLAELATSVNTLVATVDDGFAQISAVMGEVAEGRLDTKMHGTYSGAFEELQNNINATIDQLGTFVSRIAGTSDRIKDGASEISTNASALAGRTDEQAAAIEEINATMANIAEASTDNTRMASELSDQAGDAASQAERGRDVAEAAADAMRRLETGSSKIGEIVGVIDSIAFQTNLLALNAAVEAARAGEAGKGFAVVASEVRTLAQRSSEAAADIRRVIDDSSSQVAEGVARVAETKTALADIVTAIQSVSSAGQDITGASDQQTASSREIAQAISEMDDLTQQNSSMAVNSANSARKPARRSRPPVRADLALQTAGRRDGVGAFRSLINQCSRAPGAISASGATRTTAPSASLRPRVRTSDMNGPIWRGGKFTTAITERPIIVSGV